MRFSRPWLCVLQALAITLAVGTFESACSSDQRHTSGQSEGPNGDALPRGPADHPSAAQRADTATAQETLSDAQIALIVQLINAAELEQGKLAQSKARAVNVRSFADTLVEQHSRAELEQTKLFKQLGLTPAGSARADAFRVDGDKTIQALYRADDASFDAAFVHSQVESYQRVLDALDARLLPTSRGAELNDALQRMRTTVAGHLAAARALASP